MKIVSPFDGGAQLSRAGAAKVANTAAGNRSAKRNEDVTTWRNINLEKFFLAADDIRWQPRYTAQSRSLKNDFQTPEHKILL